MNTENYSVSLRIQIECGKIRTRITPNTDTFQAVPLESRKWNSRNTVRLLAARFLYRTVQNQFFQYREIMYLILIYKHKVCQVFRDSYFSGQ